MGTYRGTETTIYSKGRNCRTVRKIPVSASVACTLHPSTSPDHSLQTLRLALQVP